MLKREFLGLKMLEIRNLKSGEEDKLIETMYDVFKYDSGVASCDYFRKHVMSEDLYNPSNIKIIVDNEKILSHVVIQEREMYTPNSTIKVGSISLVGTLEEHRKNGYATKLLNNAIEDMKNRNYDASILFTKNPYFKNTLWKTLKREFIISGLKECKSKTTTKNFNELANVNIIDLLQKYYHSFSKDKKFLLKRSESYLKNRLPNDFMFPKDDFYFFFDKGEFVGYAIYETKDPLVWIREAIWKDDNLDDVVIKASQLAKQNSLTKIGMFGSWLKKYDILDIIDKMDNNFYKEEIKMLPLKENIKLPKEPIEFWPADHF